MTIEPKDIRIVTTLSFKLNFPDRVVSLVYLPTGLTVSKNQSEAGGYFEAVEDCFNALVKKLDSRESFDVKEKQKRLDQMYMKIAELQAEQSQAVRAKVGACAVTENGVLLTGWNGTPPGYPNVCEETLPDGSLRTLDDVLHAEENAVNKAAREGVSLKGATMYVTLQPCRKCSAVLKSAGILRLVYKEEYVSASRSGAGTDKLKEHGVIVEQLKE